MDSPNDKKNNHLGITFDEIHSDEQHEAVSAQKTETNFGHTNAKSHLSGQGSVFNVSNAFKDDAVEEGTIVSDKRTHRHSFGESLKDAWSEWLGDAKEKISEMSDKVETLQVADAPKIATVETRKEVVEKAATYASLAPKDDSKIVIEKIRTYKKDVAKITDSPITIKAPSTEAPSWKHAGEENVASIHTFTAPDLRSTMVAPVIAQKIKKGLDDYTSKSTTPTQTSASASTPTFTPSPRVYLGNKSDARKNPLSVAPIISQNIKKDLEAFSTPTKVQSAETITEHVVRPAFVSQRPAVAETPRFMASAPEATAAPSPEIIPAPVPQSAPAYEVPIPAPQSTVEAPTPKEEVPFIPVSSLEGATPPDSMPEFRSAPLPDFAKQEISARMLDAERPVSQNNQVRPFTQRESFLSSSLFRTIVRGGAVLSIVLIGTSLAFYVKSRTGGDTQPVVEVVDPVVLTVPTLISTDAQHKVALTGSPSAFRETLHASMQSVTSGITQFYPTVSEGTYDRPATSKEVFDYMNAHIPQNAKQSLDNDIVFGSIFTTKSEPFIIIRSYNFDMLFTGMLAWEQHLFVDFNPFFGTTPPQSLLFKDAVRNNASTRILYDEAGNEVLLYSFINKNTVIITSSGEALSALVSRF